MKNTFRTQFSSKKKSIASQCSKPLVQCAKSYFMSKGNAYAQNQGNLCKVQYVPELQFCLSSLVHQKLKLENIIKPIKDIILFPQDDATAESSFTFITLVVKHMSPNFNNKQNSGKNQVKPSQSINISMTHISVSSVFWNLTGEIGFY